MTEPAQQPLFELEEQTAPTKKSSKRAAAKTATGAGVPRRAASKAPAEKAVTTKPATSKVASAKALTAKPSASRRTASKPAAVTAVETVVAETAEVAPISETVGMESKPATKPRVTRRKKSESAAVSEPAEAALPAVMAVAEPRSEAPAPQASLPAQIEEWSPSAAKKEVSASAPAAIEAAPAQPLPAQPAPAPAPQGVRQYPVYVPRHVAKQLEQEGKQAPIAVTAHEAAEMQIPRVEQPAPRPERGNHRQERGGDRHERGERHDRGDRNDRHDRGGDRNERHDRGERAGDRNETARTEPLPRDEELGFGEGIVEISGKGFGFIRDPKRGFVQNPSDIFVTPEIVRRYNLRDGQWIKGETRKGNRGAQLHRLTEVNGDEPESSRQLPSFDELTVISPLEWIKLE
ncbi:MAG: hypothetical protein V4710_08865, partial [Verrucomicrobiota bacterium]